MPSNIVCIWVFELGAGKASGEGGNRDQEGAVLGVLYLYINL